ncbi:MAG: cation:proton antiporter [Spirochaetales bacterium]|nr:cation:proton antiporter [Spirochaetales bacterium]
MAFSLAEVLILSLIVDWLFKKIKVPGLVGILIVGMVAGPYILSLLKPELMNVSSDLRMIALIVILLRAGFELSKETLRKIGLYAFLLSFIPAVLEGVAITFLGHFLLNLSYLEAAILGAVLSAVSPAVVVPLMLKFIDEKKGAEKGIPTMILAASSIDDVFVIVVYSVLIGIYTGVKVNILWKLAGIPISIFSGIAVGLLFGFILYFIFEKFNPRATKRLLVVLSVAIVFVNIEHLIDNFFPFAALLAVMAVGFIILEKSEFMAHEISSKLGKLWVFAEIILFALVGAQVNIQVALNAVFIGSIVIILGLIARSIGTYLCLIKSGLTRSEKLFVVISYLPKATVQAAIGGAPLLAMQAAGMGTAPGEIILAVAVLSILLTAPAGAWAIAFVGNRVLKRAPLDMSKHQLTQEITRDDLLDSYKIGKLLIMDAIVIRENAKIKDAIRLFDASDFLICPVIDSENRYAGIIKLEDIRSVLDKQHAWDITLVHDAMTPLEHPLRPSSRLREGLETAEKLNLEQLPVIDNESNKVIGVFDTRDAKRFLEHKLIECKTDD